MRCQWEALKKVKVPNKVVLSNIAIHSFHPLFHKINLRPTTHLSPQRIRLLQVTHIIKCRDNKWLVQFISHFSTKVTNK